MWKIQAKMKPSIDDDLESQKTSLPRLERDPFDLSNDDNEIETLNSAKYSQASKFREYEDSSGNEASASIQLNPYGQSASSMALNDEDTLNDEDYLQQPLNSSYSTRKSKRHSPRHHHKKPLGGYRNRDPPRVFLIALVIIVPVTIVIMLFLLLKWTSPTESKNAAPATAATGLTYPSGFNMKNNWGSLSPYFDTGATFPEIDPTVNEGLHELPKHCKLQQVHVLHRHAERFPTSGSGASMEATAFKLKNMTEPPAKVLEWLNDWKYTFDTELLVSKGYGTEYAAGASLWATHGIQLFNATESGRFLYDPELNIYPNGTARPPVVIRATSQSRIRNSAKAWAAGFFGLFGEDPMRSEKSISLLKDPKNIYSLVLQQEAANNNSTLAAYYSCPNGNKAKYSNGGKNARQWIDIYLQEAVVRLSKLLPGLDADKEETDKNDHTVPAEVKAGSNEKDGKGNDSKNTPGSKKSTTLTTTDVFNMQNLCAYETAAYGSSPFCKLFTEKEWRGYEYAADLLFYGSASYGTPVGAAEGSGWLYELLARLKGRQLSENEAGWGINTTLTSTPDVFPVDQAIYLDMSHDSILVSVLTALGLDFLKEDLPSTKILAPRQFVLSRLTPFGARIYVEVLSCGEEEEEDLLEKLENTANEVADKPSRTRSDASESNKQKHRSEAVKRSTFVRIKVNNRVLPLNSLKNCPVDKKGLCPLGDFTESLKHSLSEIDFDRNCYGIPKGYEDAKDDETENEARRFLWNRN